MPSILIVDDEINVRELFRRAFESEGFEVEEAENGRACMAICQKKTIDLVMLDIFMPDKDGLEVLQEFRKDFPALKVIAITGYKSSALSVAEKLGATYTLRKPLSVDEVLATARACLTN